MLNISKIERFLKSVDNSFEVKLSSKQDLKLLSEKFFNKATVCYEERDENVVSMIAGYTENLINNYAFISVVATIPEFCYLGFASKLIAQFIDISKKKEITAIHLYASSQGLLLYKNADL